jgi:hypothetical protein
MTPEGLQELFAFVQAEVNPRRVKKLIHRKMNSQTFRPGESYSRWEEQDREQLVALCGPLAETYGYSL